MKKTMAVILLATLSACGEPDQRLKKINHDLNDKGYAEVGKTPDGQPLYMKTIDLGHSRDRVYFTKDSISAVEDCGKNCEQTITTTRKPL